MEAPRPHAAETARLAALRSLNVLDTDVEERFDRLTTLLATTLDVPIALVSLVDADRQWFKSCHGLDVRETPRDQAFCAHAIVADGELFVIPDALADPRFRDNPLVAGAPHIRFYAGCVVRSTDGSPLGTLCAIDRRPRDLSSVQLEILEQIARLVELELQRVSHAELVAAVESGERQREIILDTAGEGFLLQDRDGSIVGWNPAAERLLGLTGDQLRGRTSNDMAWQAVRLDGSPFPAEERPSVRALRTGSPVERMTYGVRHASGRRLWLRVSAQPVVQDGVTTGVVTSFADVTTEVEEARRRRELEAELERSERTARVSLDALEQGVILGRTDGYISRINPAARSILGYTAAELTERWQSPDWLTWDEHWQALDGLDRPVLRALATGDPVVGQIIGWRRKDGERILLRISCVPNVDGEGSVVIAFTEVTAEYHARQLLDTVLEVAPVGLAVLDAEGGILRSNQRFATQLGRTRDELKGRIALDIVHPDDLERVAPISAELLSGREHRVNFEHRVRSEDDQERWLDTSIAVSGVGDQKFSVAAAFDVTERRRMVQNLARYRHLFRNANDIIVVLDASGTIVLASPSAEQMFGEIVGAPVASVVHPDDREIAAAAIGPDGNDDRPPITVRVIDASGGTVYLECVGADLLAEPAVRGIVVTGRDVTARVEITAQIERRATRDNLTDLFNRHHLQTVVDAVLADRSDDHGVGLLFIDLDGFKQINDNHGHAAGDQVLCEIAELLEDTIRSNDLAARVGGDEFVVLLDGLPSADRALAVATRFRDAVVARPHTFGPLGASVGIALAEPGDTFSTLIDRADAAMYRAKARSEGSAIELAIGETFVPAMSAADARAGDADDVDDLADDDIAPWAVAMEVATHRGGGGA